MAAPPRKNRRCIILGNLFPLHCSDSIKGLIKLLKSQGGKWGRLVVPASDIPGRFYVRG